MTEPVPQPDGRVVSQELDVDSARAVLLSEQRDAEEMLEKTRKRYQRHVLWIALGISPGALVPMLYAFSEFGGNALVLVIALVIVLESWRAMKARMEVKRMEVVVQDFQGRIGELHEDGSDQDPAGP